MSIEKRSETVTQYKVLGTWVKDETARKLYEELKKEFDKSSGSDDLEVMDVKAVSVYPLAGGCGAIVAYPKEGIHTVRLELDEREWKFIGQRIREARY